MNANDLFLEKIMKITFSLLILIVVTVSGCATTTELNTPSPSNGIEQYREQLAKANAVYHRKSYNDALSGYLSLYQQNKQDVLVLFRLGNIYSHLEQYKNAVQAYERTLLLSPQMSKAWYNLGVVRTRLSIKTWQNMAATIDKNDPLMKAANHYNSKLLAIIETEK